MKKRANDGSLKRALRAEFRGPAFAKASARQAEVRGQIKNNRLTEGNEVVAVLVTSTESNKQALVTSASTMASI